MAHLKFHDKLGYQTLIDLLDQTAQCGNSYGMQGPTTAIPQQIIVSNVSTHEVSLTWENKDAAASEYSDRILIANEPSSTRNMISNTRKALITDLNPGTFYQFTIFPRAADKKTEGDPNSTLIYTNHSPSPVSDIQATYISTEQVTLTWENNDTAAPNYTYMIYTDGNGISPTRNQTSQNKNAVILGLRPGTLYDFTIVPLAADNMAEGDPKVIHIYTKPSPVFNIRVTSILACEVNLTWQNDDTAASDYNYRIHIENETSPVGNQTFKAICAVVIDVEPGTSYKFTIFPLAADNKNGLYINLFSKPSAVSNLKVINVGTTEVTLTWQNSDAEASNYTYKILYGDYGTSVQQNITSQTTNATITGLQPGTSYLFTVFAQAGGTEGNSTVVETYTSKSLESLSRKHSEIIICHLIPFSDSRNFYTSLTENPTFQLINLFMKITDLGAISNLKVINVGTTEVTLTWQNSDAEASNYTYKILYGDYGTSVQQNITSQTTNATITGLQPGTSYLFTVFAQAGGTEGNSTVVETYTKPSAVSNLKVINVGTTEVTLTWQNSDAEASNYTYRIFCKNYRTSVQQNITSQTTNATITGLQPGTSYLFMVFSQVAGIEGDSSTINTYTKPSPISDIQATNIGTKQVTLTWENNDTAAPNYTYVIYTDGNGISPTRNQTSQNKNAVIVGLRPGTSYNFTIVPLAADSMTKGDSNWIHICTVPSFNCTPVTKEPKLTVKWEPPAGTSTGFSINTFNDAWSNETLVLAGFDTTVTNLNYSTSYNVSIITRSCGKESLPMQTTCDTSITDPPAPVEKPIITSITHNSFKIQFSGFESKNGPLTAYAIVITTAKEGNIPPNSSLNDTYNDFKEKKTKTYITNVINATQMRAFSSRSNSLQYEMEVGDSSKSYAYSNAPLKPLGSYWVSVAGFTKIEFNDDRIDEERSYVSFTPYSQAIILLQDPGKAKIKCSSPGISFVFCIHSSNLFPPLPNRKDGKNSELPFSPIRSKSIKVENFESYFKKQQADSNCGFAEEYEELRSVGINQPKFAAELTENRRKNRYNNVLPYDISRVKLSIQNHPADDYINANYMPGYNSKKEFIAAQGPLPNTVQDFWRMIWEKNIYAIVMLTKCVEQGRTKCEEYWPDKGSNYYDDITVTLVSECVLPEWTIRDFIVEGSNATESHSVRQFHFTSWPDHGVPETTDLLINFRHLVQENIRQNPPDSPILVHCSAGVGRTGTFIAIDRLIQQIEMENVSDVYGVVYDLRMHRPLMVQTEENNKVLDILKSIIQSKVSCLLI
uniref:Receptor-type tyrosine-protein phosphatase eta n=1 Tax=Chelonoidis abingdonii TaxID=106734 RepID=A0A8C0GHX6_CHEAB